MKLKHLTITNCSRIRDLDILVRDNLVIIGPNGSGKTTVLQCLDMLLGMNKQRLRETIAKDFIQDQTRPFAVHASFCDLSPDELAVFQGEVDVQNDCELAVRLEVTATDNCDDINVEWSFPNGETSKPPSQAQRDAFGWTLLQEQEYGLAIKDLELAPDASLYDNLINSVRFKTKEDGSMILPHENSDGNRALFAMATFDLMHGDANVLAIDEPETHLHPSSQRSLAKMLKAGGSQKILVTHSPTIAGSFEPEEIVVIRTDGLAVQPKDGFLKDDAGMLARWWIGRQLEPLTAGIVIAVEGPSDRIIVNQVASALGFDLDRHDVVVVEADGCGDMKAIKAVFGKEGFDIPLFVLVDEDAREETARRFGADPDNPADLEAHRIFVSTNDLEDEYVRAVGPEKLWGKLRTMRTFSGNAFKLCDVGPDGNPTASSLAAFIRGKSNRKIRTALVAASLIDSSNANKVKSVTALLKAVRA